MYQLEKDGLLNVLKNHLIELQVRENPIDISSGILFCVQVFYRRPVVRIIW